MSRTLPGLNCEASAHSVSLPPFSEQGQVLAECDALTTDDRKEAKYFLFALDRLLGEVIEYKYVIFKH